MVNTDLEREHLQEIAYIKAQKDIEEWEQYENELKKADIVVIGPKFKKVFSTSRKRIRQRIAI